MKYTFAALATSIASLAVAHPGHDHNAWTLLSHSIAPAAITAIAAIYFVSKKIMK